MDAKAQKLLSREIDNMERVKHPNVIQLFEVSIIYCYALLSRWE